MPIILKIIQLQDLDIFQIELIFINPKAFIYDNNTYTNIFNGK